MRIHISSLIIIFFFSSIANAQVRLPALVQDSMVLQRDARINIWGWASPGETVRVNFAGKNYTTKASGERKWKTSLLPAKAGGPFTMRITGRNEIVLKNILVGDVWFCSGQSNMVLPMERVKEKYAEEIANANYPHIRHFFIPTVTNIAGQSNDLPQGNWRSASGNDLLSFSATAYFFAKSLHQKYKVPIGIINASVGGTPIEAWMSEEGVKSFDEATSLIKRNKDTAFVSEFNRKAAAQNIPVNGFSDKGMMEAVKWFDVNYQPKNWQSIYLPGYWEDQGARLDGIVWYRKEIDVPASLAGLPAKLMMGRIIDADEAYVNGKRVGNVTYQYPPRRYQLPAGLLKAGKNTIVIRVTNYSGKGGFDPGKDYFLQVGNERIELHGKWMYKVGEVFQPQKMAETISEIHQPTALYNAMVAPATSYNVKGFVWYQGETNMNRNPHQYGDLLKSLISDWRKQWSLPDAPFLFAQLPILNAADYLPTESNMAVLREGQRSALSLPNTAMAVTLDAGEWNDIHPLNKKDVGERLALAAQKIAYGDNVVYSGPVLTSAQAEGNKVMLSFSHTGSGLTTSDDEPPGAFALAGHDKKFVWATANIEGEKIILTSDKIKHPVYVRYAWADNPAGANLYNKEGLPASPFEAEVKHDDNNRPWNHHKAAVVLTYDDALDVHLNNVIPALDSLGMKATFYLSNEQNQLSRQLQRWKTAAVNGHELGNHTINHPCLGNRPGREWVKSEQDLSRYSIQRMTQEIGTMNTLLQAIDGKDKRSFAYTCGDSKIGDTSFMPLVQQRLTAARGVHAGMPTPADADLYNIPAYSINGHNGAYMISLVKEALEKNRLVVFLFHGVGGGYSLNVSLEAHRQLLQFLKKHEQELWIAPLTEIAEHIRHNKNNN